MANLHDTACSLHSHGHYIHITQLILHLPLTSQRWSKLSCALPACIYSDFVKKSNFFNKNWGKIKRIVYSGWFSQVWKVMTFATNEWCLFLCSPSIHHLFIIHEKIRIASSDSIQWFCHVRFSKNEMWPWNENKKRLVWKVVPVHCMYLTCHLSQIFNPQVKVFDSVKQSLLKAILSTS